MTGAALIEASSGNIGIYRGIQILTFLFEHQHRIGEDKLSLRMFCKAQELYVAMPDSWRDYVEDMLLTPRLRGP